MLRGPCQVSRAMQLCLRASLHRMEASRSTPCECLVTIPRSAPGDPRSKKTWTGLSLGEAQRTQRTSDARGDRKSVV